MTLFKSSLVLLLCLAILTTCEKDTNVLLRVENISAFDYQDIYINSNGAEHNFGDLASGGKSEYVRFEKAYRYGFISLMVDTTQYILQPIDYVGESPLESGKYTYQLDAFPVNSSFGSLGLNLKED